MSYRERPSSWYDSPDEPTDAQYEACRAEWEEYLDSYCDNGNGCYMSPADGDKPHLDVLQPCGSCYDNPPVDYEKWQVSWFDKQDADRRWA
jgi:hypothetical protein